MIRRASIKTIRIDLQVQEGTTTGDLVEVLLLLELNSRSAAVWLLGLLFSYMLSSGEVRISIRGTTRDLKLFSRAGKVTQNVYDLHNIL